MRHYFSLNFWILLVFILGSTLLQAAPAVKTPHALAQLMVPYSQVKPGDTIQVGVSITPEKGWHTYWKNPGDSGLPVRLEWNLPKGFMAGPTQWPVPEKLITDPLINYGYAHEAILLTDIQIPRRADLKEGNVLLSVTANWLICEEACVPESAVLTLSLPLTTETKVADAAWLSKTKRAIPKSYPHSFRIERRSDTELHFIARYPDPDAIKSVEFFPDQTFPLEPSAPLTFMMLPDGFDLKIRVKPSAVDRIEGVVQFNLKQGAPLAYEVTAPILGKSVQASSFLPFEQILIMILFAFLGGLILNVMPCVFPILSLKIISLMSQAKKTQKKIRQEAVLYTSGVLVGMLSLFIAITALKAGGAVLGWGFHLQSALFVGVLIYLMAYIGFYLLDVAPLPSVFYSLSGKAGAAVGGKRKSFLTGLLAVVVATPCTAPFMAVAIGAAFAQPPLIGFVIFVSLSLGFSFPFLAFGIWPALGKHFPKPGRWMEILKEIMAFPMFLTALWLLWVLSTQLGFSGVVTVLMGIILIGFGCWFSRVSPRHSLIGWVLIVMILGVSLISFNSGTALSAEEASYTPQSIEALRNSGKKVFVDVTAAWCITCQVNERRVLESEEVKTLFQKNDITVVTLDWTSQDPAITRYLESFGRSAVPLYVYYSPQSEPIVLSQLLSISELRSILLMHQ